MFDTHCHLHSSEFDSDRDSVLKVLTTQGIQCVTVATSLKSSQKAIDLSKQHPDKIWASAGMHPHEACSDLLCAHNIRVFSQLASQSQVVAIGETGFDFYYNPKEYTYEYQRDIFQCQIEMSQDLNKPLIIHTRESFQETYDLLKEYTGLTIIYHCFTGDTDWVRKFSSLPHISYFSFSGIITFRNKVEHIQEAAKFTPIESLLIETDSPYLAPVPHRGLRNQPTFLPIILQKMADLRGLDPKELESHLDANARRVFQI